MAGEHEWTAPGKWEHTTIECIGGDNGGMGGGSAFRKELDYERNAHRETTELLIEKDQQKQQVEIALGVLRRDLDVQKAQVRVLLDEVKALHGRSDRELDVLRLCIPLVRDLFAATNSGKEHAGCQAALAAYEELTDAPVASQPAPDPVDVGLPQPRHLSDCQQERVGGMGGGQLSGPAGRTQDGDWAQQYSRAFLKAFARCGTGSSVAVEQQAQKKNK